jgi:hypothetical protein
METRIILHDLEQRKEISLKVGDLVSSPSPENAAEAAKKVSISKLCESCLKEWENFVPKNLCFIYHGSFILIKQEHIELDPNCKVIFCLHIDNCESYESIAMDKVSLNSALDWINKQPNEELLQYSQLTQMISGLHGSHFHFCFSLLCFHRFLSFSLSKNSGRTCYRPSSTS